MATLKVGELAKRTGLTVRTLHHYDAIGLLRPTRRTAAGYRLYEDGDVMRLQRIVSLRRLGFTLDEIAACLGDPAFSLRRVVRMHTERLRDELEAQRRLCERLEALADRLDRAEPVSVDEFLESMEAMAMVEKYYTEEQLETLRKRRDELGEDRIRAVEAEWPDLIAKVKAELEKGTDPADPAVRALARRWMELVREFTGGDPGIAASLRNMYAAEPAVQERAGLDASLFDYVRRAAEAAPE